MTIGQRSMRSVVRDQRSKVKGQDDHWSAVNVVSGQDDHRSAVNAVSGHGLVHGSRPSFRRRAFDLLDLVKRCASLDTRASFAICILLLLINYRLLVINY